MSIPRARLFTTLLRSKRRSQLQVRSSTSSPIRIFSVPSFTYILVYSLLIFSTRVAVYRPDGSRVLGSSTENAEPSSYTLAGDPDFLVLDEPVNGLDPQGIIEMRELILRLNREHDITVLMSSHILDELSRLATHYGFIDGGRMIREISAEDLEAACRKCIRAEVSDMGALTRVMDSMGVEYKVISDRKADIYAKLSVTELAVALAKEGCELIAVTEKDESLESYYVNLVGGESYD